MNLNGKKGNAFTDSLTAIIILFIFGVIGVLSFTILNDVNDDIQGSEMNDLTKDKLQTLTDGYPSWFDYAFLTAFILLWIATIIFSFLVDTHPIFLIITIILLVLVMFFGGILTNTYEEMSEEDEFQVDAFPITNFILSNLLLVVLLFGVSISLALYGKSRGGGL